MTLTFINILSCRLSVPEFILNIFFNAFYKLFYNYYGVGSLQFMGLTFKYYLCFVRTMFVDSFYGVILYIKYFYTFMFLIVWVSDINLLSPGNQIKHQSWWAGRSGQSVDHRVWRPRFRSQMCCHHCWERWGKPLYLWLTFTVFNGYCHRMLLPVSEHL